MIYAMIMTLPYFVWYNALNEGLAYGIYAHNNRCFGFNTNFISNA